VARGERIGTDLVHVVATRPTASMEPTSVIDSWPGRLMPRIARLRPATFLRGILAGRSITRGEPSWPARPR
jgi:hypothetical protein